MSLTEGIAQSYIAKGLTQDEVSLIASISTPVEVSAGDVIFQRSTKDKDLYVVLDGKAVINGVNKDLITRIGPGGVFGEIALLDDRPRSATVHAETDAKMAFIPASSLRALMEENPEIGVKILRNLGQTLCERLRSANLQIEALLAGLDMP